MICPAGTIIDVGAGRGSQIVAILHSNPLSRGVLYDLPHVIPVAEKPLENAGLGERCECIAGDFFTSVPPGGDVYLLKKVIHDWDDERAQKILTNCRAGMSSQARLLLVEHVLPAINEPSWSRWLDLQMLALTPGGRERTETEYAALFASSGLALSRIIPTSGGPSIIEGVPT